MIHKKSRFLMTLVALIAMTTGTWAVDAPNTKSFTVPDSWKDVVDDYTEADLPDDFVACTDDEAAAWAAACTEEQAVLIYSIGNCYIKLPNVSYKIPYTKTDLFGVNGSGMTIYYTVAAAPADPEVTWDAATNTGTLTMPAGNVELQVEYWPGMLTLKSDNEDGGTVALVMKGTTLPAGIEQDDQGNIYVESGTPFTIKATPSEGYRLVSWSNGAGVTDDGTQTITMLGYNDFTVTATFSNEYDIAFFPTNTNSPYTIGGTSGQATVSVKDGDGAAVDKTNEIADGKLTGVQTGQTVTIEAKTGYKFKNVIAKTGLPLNRQLVTKDWYFAYSLLGDYAQPKWKLAQAGSADEGELISNAKFSTANTNGDFGIYLKSGEYDCFYHFNYEFVGDDEIVMYFNGKGSEDALWYYKNAGHSGIVAPFGANDQKARTFKLTTDDAANPSYIELSDQSEPTNVIKVVKETIIDTFDN